MTDAANELHGHVTAIDRQNDGDELTAAVSPDDMVLSVIDVADFNEDGGVLRLGEVVYPYVGIDDDTSTITLEAPGLTAAAAVGDAVDVWNSEAGSVVLEFIATVVDETTDDVIQAVVAHDLADRMAANIRGLVGESVVCEEDGDGIWFLTRVRGQSPAIGAEFVELPNGGSLPDTLGDLDIALDYLNTVTLPQLQADLADNEAALAVLDGLFPITATSISDNAITTPKLAANSVLADKIAANQINASHIVANSIGADQIAANSIGADEIIANSIGADEIAANAITAAKIAADAIDGKTITAVSLLGAYLRTTSAATGNRVEVNGDYVNLFGSAASASLNGNSSLLNKLTVNDWVNVIGFLAASSVIADGDVQGADLIATAQAGGGTVGVSISSGGRIIRGAPSTRKVKKNIKRMALKVAERVLDLEAVTYQRRIDKSHPEEHDDTVYPGFIVEQAVEVGADLWVSHDTDGTASGFRYSEMTVAHNEILRAHRDQIADLTARIVALEGAQHG